MEPQEITLAQAAYDRYGAVTNYLNFQGNPMPKWDELPGKIQEAWIAAANPIPTVASVNAQVPYLGDEADQVSDGYHTFHELYEHRITLYIALCRYVCYDGFSKVWRTKAHSDGSVWPGWFLLGITTKNNQQISYHLPECFWSVCEEQLTGHGFYTLDQAPAFDGHTSADVLTRLFTL